MADAFKYMIMQKKLLKAFSELCGCGVCVLTPEGTEHFGRLCGHECRLKNGVECENFQKNAFSDKASDKCTLIYRCPENYYFCAAKLTGTSEVSDSPAWLTAGPLELKSDENADFADKNTFSHGDIDNIAEILGAVAAKLSGSGGEYITGENQTDGGGDGRVSDYLQSVRDRMLLGIDGYSAYPYDKEKKLISAIISGDGVNARKYLNELLGNIFFVSAYDLATIKQRAMELTVLISRAAIDAGAEPSNIYSSDPAVMTNFLSLENIDDVCVALTDILDRFIDETFKKLPVKHVELLSRVVSYVNSNYMHKITLESAAEHAFLSPSYLSRLFREEMNTSFSAYLSYVRVEKSKLLLKSDKITISEAAELVGFCDQSYFNKVFRKNTGVTPGYYREKGGNVPKFKINEKISRPHLK